MRESSYKKINSLFHGKREKNIRTTRVNVFHEYRCKNTPKEEGGEGTN
jgi:hypothetical protein